MSSLRTILAFVFALGVQLSLCAQQNIPGPPVGASPIEEFKLQQPETAAGGIGGISRVQYEDFVFAHRRAVFEWQHFSSKVIFWVVITIVLVGLFFAGMQFYISLRRRTGDRQPDTDADRPAQETELEASLQGIKVRSSVLGVIILVIALGFLYLYLVHVYPIRVTQETILAEPEQ